MGVNFPGGNIPVGGWGDLPGGSLIGLIGGTFPGGSFSDTIIMSRQLSTAKGKYVKYMNDEKLQIAELFTKRKGSFKKYVK